MLRCNTHDLKLDSLAFELNGADFKVDTDGCEVAIIRTKKDQYDASDVSSLIVGAGRDTHWKYTTQYKCRRRIEVEDMTFRHPSHR